MSQDIEAMIGSRLRTRRRLLGMTQKDIGQKLGVTPQMVHKWETAQGTLYAATVHDLARVLGVEAGLFLPGRRIRVPAPRRGPYSAASAGGLNASTCVQSSPRG